MNVEQTESRKRLSILPRCGRNEHNGGRSLPSVVTVLLCVSVTINLWFLIKSLPLPILDEHAFRQTQTALTAHYLANGGSILSYETPVLGYPWAIPMEFPTYQIIVGYFKNWSGIKLDAAGRIVSFLFHGLTAAAIFLIVRKLRIDALFSLVFATLYFSSPLYIFWGRSFMIETCANFFGAVFVYFLVGLALESTALKKWGIFYPGCIVAGTVCALTKVTTFPGFVAAGGFLLILMQFRKQVAIKGVTWYLLLASVIVLPLIVTQIWVQHADAIKMHNVVGRKITSDALMRWNFGTLEQRVGWPFWSVVFGRAARDTLGIELVFVLPGFGLIGGKARLIAGGLLALYLIPFLLFANLHVVHNYYQVANGVFLIAFMSYVVHQSYYDGRSTVAVWLITLVVCAQVYEFGHGYYRSTADVLKNHRTTIAVSDFVRKNTDPRSSILVFGYDWSSEIAYYSRRKSLAVPRWLLYQDVLAAIGYPKREMGGMPISAIVDANDTRKEILREGKPDIFCGYRKVEIEDCTVYFDYSRREAGDGR